MAHGSAFRIGFSLLAGVMIGMPGVLASFSADAHARHHHRMHSSHFAPANTSAPASSQNAMHGVQKSEEHNAPNPETALDKTNDDKRPGRYSVGAGQGGNEGAAGSATTNSGTKGTNLPDMKDLGPVDSSNTIVRPRLQGAKAEVTRQGPSKINSKTGKYFHARHAFVRHNSSPVVRNTVGVSITPRVVTAGQHGVRSGAPVSDKPGAEKGVVSGSPGPAGAFHPSAGSGSGVTFTNHGALSGSSFPHRGFNPTALGGQTKMTGTLSGSMIRPKY